MKSRKFHRKSDVNPNRKSNIKPHRKLVNFKIKRDINTTKLDKGFIERTRNHIEVEDRNRNWTVKNMSKNLINSIGVSQINTISSRRDERIKQQTETSEALHKITMEYNELERKYKKRDKQLKEDVIVKDYLEKLTRKQKQQEKLIVGHKKRKKELETEEALFKTQ
jgi:hypothetical protein